MPTRRGGRRCRVAAARAMRAVARQPGAVLAVLVADCLPVLLAARDGSAVAVAHAGWRGLAAGVLEATVGALAGHGPLQAWLGPAIGPAHFEVGEEVRAVFWRTTARQRRGLYAPMRAAAGSATCRRWRGRGWRRSACSPIRCRRALQLSPSRSASTPIAATGPPAAWRP